MDIVIIPLLHVALRVLDLYQMFLIVYIIISWLEAFNILNTYNKFVYMIQGFFYRIYEPVLGRIRAFMPSVGTLDLSPIVLIFALYFIKDVLIMVLRKFPQ